MLCTVFDFGNHSNDIYFYCIVSFVLFVCYVFFTDKFHVQLLNEFLDLQNDMYVCMYVCMYFFFYVVYCLLHYSSNTTSFTVLYTLRFNYLTFLIATILYCI